MYGNLDDLCLDETTNHGELNEAIAELKDEVEELLEEFSNDELRGSYIIFVLISNQNINEDAKITLLNLLR